VPVQVRNTGELGGDTYNLTTDMPTGSGWHIAYYTSDGVTALTDTGSDGLPDTGSIPQGDTKTVYVEIQSSSGKDVGDYFSLDLTATSSQDPGTSDAISLQGAVPATFAQAYVDSQTGLGLETVWQYSKKLINVDDWYSGSTLAISPLTRDKYLFVWERNKQKILDVNGSELKVPFTDLEFGVIHKHLGTLRTRARLTDNEDQVSQTKQIMDRSPGMASMMGDRVGVVWVSLLIGFGQPGGDPDR